MFLGVSSGCLSQQRAVAGGGGGSQPSWLVGWTTNGSYPAGVVAGDLLVSIVHDVNPIASGVGFTSIAGGLFNGASDNYLFSYRIAAGTLSGNVYSGYAMLMILLRGFTGITGGVAAADSSTWASMSAVTVGSNILALGYSSGSAPTIGAGFTTEIAGPGVVLATSNTTNPATNYSYSGFTNNGTVKACYSLAVK